MEFFEILKGLLRKLSRKRTPVKLLVPDEATEEYVPEPEKKTDRYVPAAAAEVEHLGKDAEVLQRKCRTELHMWNRSKTRRAGNKHRKRYYDACDKFIKCQASLAMKILEAEGRFGKR